MSLDQDTINEQLDLLAAHRRTLSVYLRQHAQLGVLAPPGVANGIAEAQNAIRRIKDQLRADGVPVEDEPNDEVQPTTVAATPHLSPQEQRNRSRMLDKVEAFWVKGVLEQSLYQMARLELGFEHATDQVSHPWETVLHQANQPNEAIPARKPIVAVFDDLLGELLILGAPGAGKTTMLLELARDLIARARNNQQHPIPVVFNLSTWATRRLPLGTWLAEELNQRYDVPKKLAQEWAAANALLLLLDGLDEVAAEHRDACAEAINEFRTAYGFVPLAVCSRITDYQALTSKLRLQGAIVIQPLTKPQVDNYLKRVGRPLAAVRAALRDDPTLWELMDSPLLLSIVALAYKDASAAKLRASPTPEERRRQLFDDYIRAMFERSGRSKCALMYTRQQTAQWLSWMANQMVQHNQTVFYIERVQPNWLPPRQRLVYVLGACLAYGLIFGLGAGLLFGLTFAVIFGFGVGLAYGLGAWLVCALLGGLLAGYRPQIRSTETLRWMWSRRALGGLCFGLACGLLFALWYSTTGGLVVTLGAAMLFTLLGGLTGSELESRTTPNQGIRRSAWSALLIGLVVGLVVALGSGLVFGLGLGLGSGLVQLLGARVDIRVGVSLGFGLFLGLFFGLEYGGRSVLQHYTLRWLLSRNGSLPLRLVPFLAYCAERIFLRKVGGGYIFVHRLLMEHFASLYTEPQATEPVEAQRTGS